MGEIGDAFAAFYNETGLNCSLPITGEHLQDVSVVLFALLRVISLSSV